MPKDWLELHDFDNTKPKLQQHLEAEQISSEQLQELATVGFKSVLNLRSPDETGFLDDEQQQAETTALELHLSHSVIIITRFIN
ncbi:hypothetical protein ACSQ6I_11525 [Anabaena sp. WFMT]|uniref:hypothetical protein n=1 Tax=Anabaena sp. WFMT TaxID=3449730 RepID=UPI003F2420E6